MEDAQGMVWMYALMITAVTQKKGLNMSFDKIAYNNAYNAKNYTGISIRLHNTDDADVIDFLRSSDLNTKALICKLVRTEMKRRQTKKGWHMNNGDRKIHADYQRYPFEIIEGLAYGDKYTVGFAATYEAAQDLVYNYQARNAEAGPLVIYHRFFDDHTNSITAVQVTE